MYALLKLVVFTNVNSQIRMNDFKILKLFYSGVALLQILKQVTLML